MRTTLEIDDDVLRAAKELALREKKTAGQVISDLARKGIQGPPRRPARTKIVNGFQVLPAERRVVTPQLVHSILEETAEE